METDINQLLQNPHFEGLFDILKREDIDVREFLLALEKTLAPLIVEHRGDNQALKEEENGYILPAISVYRTLQRFHHAPLQLFREMWLQGAEKGAVYLRKKAEDEGFLSAWIKNVTPKDCNAGAFIFEIACFSETETEYHVKKCPYVELCRYYGCPEIVTVFCDSDDISFGGIHPRLIWSRKKTIGRGDELCDFHYTLLPAE